MNDPRILKAQAKLEMAKRERKRNHMNDFEVFARENIKIIPKDISKGYIQLELNEAQQIIHKKLEEQKRSTGKTRAIILKARQQGISVYTAARMYWQTSMRPYVRTVVIAHDAITSSIIFELTKNMMLQQPDDTRPVASSSNKNQLVFKETDSSYRVYTAGSGESGRGSTPTHLHASEVAFWSKGEQVLAGLFQGVADEDGSEIILESTANGAQGEFHRLWHEAVNGNNEFIPIFIPWFATSEYRDTPPPDFETTHEEDAYQEEFDLDIEQIFWRRMRISKIGEMRFKQEFPATADEAFLVSGTTVFRGEAIDAFQPTKPEVIEIWSGGDRRMFDVNPHGDLEIWDYQKRDVGYVIGADVSHGIGSDFSAAIVMNEMREVVALYKCNTIDPAQFGDMLVHLGRRYNNALVVCEANGPGLSTIQNILNEEYPNLYYRTKISQNKHEEPTSRPGFQTTVATKPAVIAGLQNAINEYNIRVPSHQIIGELKNYMHLPSGKMEAGPMFNDDCVIALALCLEGLRTHGHRLSIRTSWAKWEGLNDRDDNWM